MTTELVCTRDVARRFGVSEGTVNTTTLCPRPVTTCAGVERDADFVEFAEGGLAMGTGGGGVALLGTKELGRKGLSPLGRAPAVAMPEGHEGAGGLADLGNGQVGIFSPDAGGGTRRGRDD